MEFLSDLHTHTIVSGHAYTTLTENINYCAQHGIKILGTSEHAPSMPGAPHRWYFGNMRVLPRVINGVTLLKGCEANIMKEDGTLDMNDHDARSLDYMIVSLHEPCFEPSSKEVNTKAVLNALDKCEKIEIVGHLGNPSYELDYEQIVKKAKELDIMIEFNNSSVSGMSRNGSKKFCTEVAKLCMKYGNKVILTSDAHYCDYIAKFDETIEMLKSINFPEELIMNDPEKLIAHLKSKGKPEDLK